MRKTLLALGGLTALWVPLVAADLTGRWSLDLLPDFGGNTDIVSCSFAQDGQKLRLDCGGASIITGEVQGHSVTLRVPTGNNKELTATMSGELDDREVIITGTWRLPGGDGPHEGKFVAKRRPD